MATAEVFLGVAFLVAAVGADTSFQYYQFSDSSGSISTLGDARIYVDDLALELTNTSAGRATYDYPVRVLSPSPSTSISFETTFIFSIEAAAPGAAGAGLAFSMSSQNTSVGDAGAFLGLVTARPASAASVALPWKFFALEFDTRQDAEFHDPDGNHVGVDLNSLTSAVAAPAQSGAFPLALASGAHIQAYVAYDSVAKILDVALAPYADQDYVKPARSLISLPVVLAPALDEFMYVGFSAATAAGSVRHKVWSWTFKTTTVDARGQPVASAPDSSVSPPVASPGADQAAPGDSGGVRPLRVVLWPLLTLLAPLVALVCS